MPFYVYLHYLCISLGAVEKYPANQLYNNMRECAVVPKK